MIWLDLCSFVLSLFFYLLSLLALKKANEKSSQK